MGATRDSWALRKLQTVRWEGPWSSWFLLFNPLKSQGLSTHTQLSFLPSRWMQDAERRQKEGAEARIKALPKGPNKAGTS